MSRMGQKLVSRDSLRLDCVDTGSSCEPGSLRVTWRSPLSSLHISNILLFIFLFLLLRLLNCTGLCYNSSSDMAYLGKMKKKTQSDLMSYASRCSFITIYTYNSKTPPPQTRREKRVVETNKGVGYKRNSEINPASQCAYDLSALNSIEND